MENRLFLLFCLWVAYFSPVYSSLLINEVMPKNVSCHINDDFNFTGWIELYNSGAEDVDISTIFLSNESLNLYKWQMPSDTTLPSDNFIMPPGSYKLIYMDELNKAFHASFKLDADGGMLYLTSAEGDLLDKITYEASFRNSSLGRVDVNTEQLKIFSHPTPASANDLTSVVQEQVSAPSFSLPAGLYADPHVLEIFMDSTEANIYYTLDGSEPQVNDSLLYEGPININQTTIVRAIAAHEGLANSNVSTASYFFSDRKLTLPIISLVTDDKYMYDDSIGILVVGENGKEISGGCGATVFRANYMQDWDRPCNFELFDMNKKEQLNQEVKIGMFGACSRTNAVKSIKVNASKVYGNNKMDYSIFTSKPNLKWKSIVLRNSGNDFACSMMRDGFIQTAASSRMDIDHQAYQPSIVFINGLYYGLLNIRERSNADYIYSNYGLDEEEIYIHEGSSVNSKDGTESDYKETYDYVTSVEDINAEGVYETIASDIDINEMLNYLTTEIYLCNRDWPGGNIKAWKRIENGRWRWILYDVDFGFSLYEDNRETNAYSYVIKNAMFASLLKNNRIKRSLMTKMVVHLALTFNEDRLISIFDSLRSNVNTELSYFSSKKVKFNPNNHFNKIKIFAGKRANNVFAHTSTSLEIGDTCEL